MLLQLLWAIKYICLNYYHSQDSQLSIHQPTLQLQLLRQIHMVRFFLVYAIIQSDIGMKYCVYVCTYTSISIISGTYYKLLQTGSACYRVNSLSECSAAAVALGLSDTTASDDYQAGVTYDPPYCYFEGGSLKFNVNGLNTGSCSTSDKCVCRMGKRELTNWLYNKSYKFNQRKHISRRCPQFRHVQYNFLSHF